MLQEEKDGEGNCDSVKDSVAAAASWSDMAVQLEVETTVKTRRRKWWRDGGGGDMGGPHCIQATTMMS